MQSNSSPVNQMNGVTVRGTARGVRAAASCLLVLCWASMTRADEFQLSKGKVEGELVRETNSFITIRTRTGTLDLPSDVVVRRTETPSLLDQYQQRRGDDSLSAAQHADLARWCHENRLAEQSAEHVAEALKLDPDQPTARRLAGFAKAGGVWLKVNDAPYPPIKQESKNDNAEVILDTLRRGWMKRIKLLHENLNKETPEAREAAREQLATIEAPLAIPILTQRFAAESTDRRLLLVELLGHFPQEQATLDLLMLSLFDPVRQVRESAAAALKQRGDGKVCGALKMTLQSRSDLFVRRGAQVLGWIGDRSAAPHLVNALADGSSATGGQRLRAWFAKIEKRFDQPTDVPLPDGVVHISPAVSVLNPGSTATAWDREAKSAAGLRSEVQDALIAITGQNFGFDVEGWREWLARNPSLEQLQP